MGSTPWGFLFLRLEAEISVFKHGIGWTGIEAFWYHKWDRVPFLKVEHNDFSVCRPYFTRRFYFFHIYVLTWFALRSQFQSSFCNLSPAWNSITRTEVDREENVLEKHLRVFWWSILQKIDSHKPSSWWKCFPVLMASGGKGSLKGGDRKCKQNRPLFLVF